MQRLGNKVITLSEDDPYDIYSGEEWRETIDPTYKVSNYGRVMHWKKRRVLKPCLNRDGYKEVYIGKKRYRVHRLVALAFIPNPENKECVNHKDGLKIDNRVSNLEWVTELENRQHAEKTGLAEGVAGKRVRNWKTGTEYESIREAARQTGKKESRIADCLHGRRSSAGWEFVK
jgi:hypothetical protein